MSRPVLLLEIGGSTLPEVTPVSRAPASWAPPPAPPAEILPPSDVVAEPAVDSITLTWAASGQSGAVYVVWRANDINGAPGTWRIVARTTETRYTYTDASGAVSWWKITVEVNGISSGDSKQTPMVPVVPPTVAELVQIQQSIDQETIDRLAADAAEAQARADAITEVATSVSAEAQTRAEQIAANAEAIAQEAAARASALLNEQLAREAAISQESATRQSEVESLAYALSQVSAGSGMQFDTERVWYFDSTVQGWTGNGAPTVEEGWLRPADGPSFPYVQSPSDLAIDGAAYRYAKLRVKRVGTPVWTGHLQWTTSTDAIWDDTKSADAPEPVWDAQGVATVDFQDIPWWPATVTAIRLQVGAAQSPSDCFLLDWVAVGRPTPGAGVALVQDEAAARIAGDAAEASQRQTLAVQLRGNYTGDDLDQVATGLIADERAARVDADEVNAQAIQTLQVRMPAGDGTLATEASVTAEQLARVTGDEANAQALQSVQARLPAGDGQVASASAVDEMNSRVTETESGLQAVGERVTSIDAQVTGENAGDDDWNAGETDVHAGSTSIYTAIADGDHATARQIDQVAAEFGQFKSTATQQLEATSSELAAQAQQLTSLHSELDGKASAGVVSALSSQVEQNSQGISAVSQQLTSVQADVAGKASAQVVQGLQAEVSQNSAGLTDVLAKAFLYVITDGAGGKLVGGMEIGNDGQVVNTRFSSDTFEVISPSAVQGLEVRNGYLRVWKGGAQRIIGTGFGAAADNLIDYFGPNVGAAAASKANATMWMDTAGSAYFGGQLSAGTLKNAVQTTTIQTIGAELIDGPFTTNGHVRSVTISFSRRHVRQKAEQNSSGFTAGAGTNTCTVQIYRQLGTDAETLWNTLSASGSVQINNESDGPDIATSSWGGSMTINDTSVSDKTVRYRAVITAFTEQLVSHTSGSFSSQTIDQTLSIVSVEQ